MAQYEHLECQPRKAKSLTRKTIEIGFEVHIDDGSENEKYLIASGHLP
jgi:hypothetical protein